MDRRPPQIVAFGGGGFSMEAGDPLLDDFVLDLTGVACPRVCFLPSASGDADHYIVRFYRAFAAPRCSPSHISLFRRDTGAGPGRDVAEHLLAQDLIYVGGGSVVSLIGVWRAHGLDEVLAECWRRGIVLCGLSAGSLCWFSESVSAFHGPPQRVAGLGLLPYSNCVHYHGEPARRESYQRFMREGMAPGYAADDGAALHFRGQSLGGVVASRPDATAYWVEEVGREVSEIALQARRLGAGAARPLTAA
jgi:dipeptidase E